MPSSNLPSTDPRPQRLIDACRLLSSWSRQAAFTVLDLDFGAGEAFLATWAAWQQAPDRPARLRYAALLTAPLTRTALQSCIESLRAQAGRQLGARRHDDSGAAAGLPVADRLDELLAHWPMPGTGIRRLELEDGCLQLTLAIGDPLVLLPGSIPRCDALFLPNHAARLPRGLLREAASSLTDGGWAGCARLDPALGQALQACGLTVERVEAPPTEPEAPAEPKAPAALRARRTRGAGRAAAAPGAGREAIVIGAGLAGSACAQALARRGWRVIQLDASAGKLQAGAAGRAEPLATASGRSASNPPRSGSFQPVLAQHPGITPDDAPLSRLTRAALALSLGPWASPALRRAGRVQLCDPTLAEAALRHWPREWLQPVDARAASDHAGVRLRQGGLWIPVAAHADPVELIAAWQLPGITVLHGQARRLSRRDDGWAVHDGFGRLLAHAPQVIIAAGAAALELEIETAQTGEDASDEADRSPRPVARSLGAAGWQARRGRVTLANLPADSMPRCIVGGTGHAVPVDAGTLLLGPADADEPLASPVCPSDLAARAWARHLAHLVPGSGPRHAPPLRALEPGIRLSVRDHLPLVGPLPDAGAVLRDQAALQRNDRLPLPVHTGLWVAGALGGRGLLWSILAAEVLASPPRSRASADRAQAGAGTRP